MPIASSVLTHQIPLVSGTYILLVHMINDVFAEISYTMLYLDIQNIPVPVPVSILSNAFCVFCGWWLLIGRLLLLVSDRLHWVP